MRKRGREEGGWRDLKLELGQSTSEAPKGSVH